MFVDEDTLPKDEVALAIILNYQISYFADGDGLEGLMKHLGESPWVEVLEVLAEGFNKENPRKPVRAWNMKGFDSDLKDLIEGLTNFDPARRITAREALEYRWFNDV